MSAVQLLDSTNKISAQYLPSSVAPTFPSSTQAFSSPGETLTPNTTAQPLNSFALGPVADAGLYMYCIQVGFNPTTWVNQSSTFQFYAVRNGSALLEPGTSNDICSVKLGQPNAFCFTGLVYMNAGDTLAWRYLNDDPTTAYTGGVARIMWSYLGNILGSY